MTRILRIITSADPRTGGPIEGARRVGEIWARQGHRQDMLTLDPPGERHLVDYPGAIIPIGPPRGGGLGNRYRYSAAMVPWLAAHARDYDAVIVSGLWRYAARGAMVGLADGGVPYFVFPHGMLDPWFREGALLKHLGKQLSWWWAEGRLLGGARAVLFTSEEEMRRAEGAFWPYRVNGAVVGYGTADLGGDPAAQIAAFRAAVPALGERRFLLFLGRIHPKKGCDMLVSAFAAVAARDPGLDLVIAGPDEASLIAGLRGGLDSQTNARIHAPGMLAGEVKAGALRAAEAFVLPSHQENFGIAVAEALAGGAPVLISDKVNIWREVLADGAGLVAPDTLAGTADLLARFLALSPGERAAMRVAARACFESRFRIEETAESLLDLIERRVG
ncbi:glycosyltransferase [Sphingomonas radiodurans]|uniref:glycosyltransferase n=1 Tax=Sphingomonas radiodurans TaxID=2890321 RepID=UPI001E365FEA|nr:glycosyltransferase [Sphingomonas radiodurans]WBH17907.1 glycosyltransferase [Sphingomonas radiodurans]